MAEGRTRPEEPAPAGGPERTAVGEQYAKTRDIVVLTALLLVLVVSLAAVLVQSWPPPVTAPGGAARERPSGTGLLLWHAVLPRDTRLFLVVAAAGGLGSLIHVLRSLYEYVGNRRLRRSWLLMYALEPVVGAVLALVVYCVLRGGLTTTMASSGDINPYGVAAVAALVGMFSRQTVQKLVTVFDTLLAPAEQTTDRLTGDAGGKAPSAGQRGDDGSDPGPDR
ncbi:hypothetical protein [Streptomyces sp. NPDC048419]|uniref:hypothetical protein n=1 Tax=Streptomyces sp. NPDC048419 TaxID=3365547 RepID=UPI00371EDA82